MDKVLYFDMDGTLCDLYSVENWLAKLQSGSTQPYAAARPLYSMPAFNELVQKLKDNGWKIKVVTWGAKDASPTYNIRIAFIKRLWLLMNGFPFDDFIYQKYGMEKSNAIEGDAGFHILVDDNKQVQESWQGTDTINANLDIRVELEKLLAA